MAARPPQAASLRLGVTEPNTAITGADQAAAGVIVPDRFQREAMDAIDRGHSVLVAAPTGAGKTMVADHAVDRALEAGHKAFYTTPIKALSNQKFHDLRARYGDRVGLLTGDNTINGDAPVVVMTTEVLRNMIYVDSPALDGLRWVVLDEVHYLRDPYRGPVWEEIIIHAPLEISLVCLSATVSNLDELEAWITTVRGPTERVVEHTRPVELRNLYMVADPTAERAHLLPVFVDDRPNPRGATFDRSHRRRRGGYRTPRRVDVIERLLDERMLPAIYFLFSRAGCDDASRQARDAGLVLTTADERRQITAMVERRVEALGDDDLAVLDYAGFLAAIQAGIAPHHAGMVPPFKEAVEDCFVAGLVKVVFATETLALGVNMPARSVVLERLTKFNGASHELLTPLEYTQLTGRAGRRGIDSLGHAVVLWSPWVGFDDVAALASSRSFMLESAFRPTYNMVANLVDRYDEHQVHELLASSFAQFQADREVTRLERQLGRRRRAVEELTSAATCDRGDVAEYVRMLAERGSGRPTRDSRRAALSQLRPGDVVDVYDAGARSRIAVLSVAHRSKGAVRIKGLDRDGELHELSDDDFDVAPERLARIDLPRPFAPHLPEFRRDVSRRLSRVRLGKRRRPSRPRSDVDHPVAACPDAEAHVAAARKLERERRAAERLERRIESRTSSLRRVFDQVRALLGRRGYVEGWALTGAGHRLAGIFHECDLLAAEAIGAGLFDDIDPPAVAALASCLTFEERTASPPARRGPPDRELQHRIDRLSDLAIDLHHDESELAGPTTRPPEAGFAATAYRWARGDGLGGALGDDFSGGDFVRNVKQLVDLLRQLAQVTTRADTARAMRAAAEALQRGVVTASSAVDAGDGGADRSG